MIKEKMPQSEDNLIHNSAQVFRFFKFTGVKLNFLTISAALAFCTALFQILGIRLLILLLKGIINHDFSFVGELFLLKSFVATFPSTHDDSSLFFLVIGALFILSVICALLQYLANLAAGYQALEAKDILRNFIFQRYLTFGKLSYDRMSIGQLSSIISKLPETMANQLMALQRILSQVFSLIAYFTVMIVISWKLTVLVLLIFPIFVFSLEFLKFNRRLVAKSHMASDEMFHKKIFSILSSIALVKAQAMEEEEKKRFAQESRKEIALGFKMEKTEMLINPIQEVMLFSALLTLIITMKFMLPSARGGNVAQYFIFFYLVRLSLPGFASINHFRVAMTRVSVLVNRVLDLLNKEKEFTISDGTKEFLGIKRDIIFNGLNFSYRLRHKVLTDISFTLESGKMTAIVGPSGAGKTTILNLLLRFYDCPQQGILLDGVDIREFTVKSLMAHIAYVSQEPLLFDDTLRVNLTYGLNGSISESRLDEVAKKTHLYDFIYSLPEKWNTWIGDRGVQLSGGEKQRISLARALLKDSDILLLDEATSALDAKIEGLIREAIREAVKHKTAIVIAHRFSTIQHADSIIVLDKGRVVEQGSFNELFQKEGQFRELCEAQIFF